MEYLKAVTFGYMSTRGEWSTIESRQSLSLLKKRCHINSVILAIVVEQATPYDTIINWQSNSVLSDQEILEMIQYAKSLNLKIILKPMVNISDGSWRAKINFFDYDEPCEPTWYQWFQSYNNFMLHYAKLAEQANCEMLVIGCELVNTDRRDADWRSLINLIRSVYHGTLTYNCDKYQETNLSWWDAVDVISSSGYYPLDTMSAEFKRIGDYIKKVNKPFFFCEAGCPSRHNAQYLPNNWELMADTDLNAQRLWYEEFFNQLQKNNWVRGAGLWDWKAKLYPLSQAEINDDYAIYGKPAEQIVSQFYNKVLN